MKKKIVKAMSLALCAIFLVAGTVLGTVAYLTSKQTVTNTFTSGSVSITFTEKETNAYGVPVNPEARVIENEYKLIPGNTYQKNAKITVAAGSEASYLFVKVDPTFAALDANVLTNLNANGWKTLDGVADVYYYEEVVDASSEEKSVLVLESFTVNSALTDLSAYNGKTPTIVAYAVQATFDTASQAWTNAGFN